MLLGLGIGFFGVQSLATAVGLAGTPGTLTVADCRVDVYYVDGDHEPEDRRETRRCRGRFAAADGSTADPGHELASDTAQRGDRIAVRDDGTRYLQVGAASIAMTAAIVLTSVSMLLMGTLFLATGHQPFARLVRHVQFWEAIRKLRYGPAVLWTAIGAMLLGVLGFVLADQLP
ncbi:hypothetical protein AB0B66_24525 [Catellatospora sp. NPDC049111]|uniref:hypothetical protein n=1 Tax=Catellatospora sp. NPDC049111 TaxID=3155271 RepID=UPI0033CB7943